MQNDLPYQIARDRNELKKTTELIGRKKTMLNKSIQGMIDQFGRLNTDYASKCNNIAESLSRDSTDLGKIFEKLKILESNQVYGAARSYHIIKASTNNAMNSAVKSLETASMAKRLSGQNSKKKTGSSRLRSRDLSQEAEGLRRNSVDMAYDLEKKGRSLKQYRDLIFHLNTETDKTKRKMMRLPDVRMQMKRADLDAREANEKIGKVATAIFDRTLHINMTLYSEFRSIMAFSSTERNNIKNQG